MSWVLRGVGHEHSFPVEGPVLIGRAPECTVAITDATVSRRHAELLATPSGVAVRDLNSSNGTTVNGARVTVGDLLPGDTVAFGKVIYRLTSGAEPPAGEAVADGTVIRPLDVGAARDALAAAPAIATNVQARQLARVLDVAKRLSGEIDANRLLNLVVDLTFDLLPCDRVSLLLLDEASGELVQACSKSRLGDAASVRVPRSIARAAVEQKNPIMTENAQADSRFGSGSVVLQSVRAAICTPLLATRDRVLGALYVDTLTASEPFGEGDATMLFAFGGLAAVTLGKLRYEEESRREAQVRANFERFFAPEVAERIAREPGAIRQTGERRPAAVLFSDIRGFTTIAESIPPDSLGSLLTEYCTEMADIVFEHGGTLDKFIGDAVMAVWGAPLSAPGDADRALAAALAMHQRVASMNDRWRHTSFPELAIGIGLNYGEVFAGYLGSERRLEYTVIGDTVNVASRLCEDAGPGEIRIAAAFVEALTIRPELARCPDVELRGKRDRVAVYRIGAADSDRPNR
ncbi:MAG: FHA domain-containing protein [Gemmatimonadetes bacterium]|nr:FHA domain-containing protein [Gemmatimonadota bacterium]